MRRLPSVEDLNEGEVPRTRARFTHHPHMKFGVCHPWSLKRALKLAVEDMLKTAHPQLDTLSTMCA